MGQKKEVSLTDNFMASYGKILIYINLLYIIKYFFKSYSTNNKDENQTCKQQTSLKPPWCSGKATRLVNK